MTASAPASVPALARSPVVTAAVPALLVGAVSIGLAPILVRLSETGPIATAAWRMGFAFVAAWAYCVALPTGPRVAPSWGDRWRLAAAGVLFAADIAFFHSALFQTTVANATLFANLAPILAGLLAWLVLAERPARGYFHGLPLAVGGACLLSLGAAQGAGTWSLTGDLLGIGAAVFYALYILQVRHLRRRFPAAQIMLWSTGAAALTLVPLMLLTEPVLLPVSPAGWAVLVGLGAVGYALGQGLIAYAMAFLPTGFSALMLLLQPVTATVLAWLLFAEILTVVQALGAALILAAVFLARPRTRRDNRQLARTSACTKRSLSITGGDRTNG